MGTVSVAAAHKPLNRRSDRRLAAFELTLSGTSIAPARDTASLGPRWSTRHKHWSLGVLLLAVTSLVVILASVPEVYDQALRLASRNHKVEIALLAALIGLITPLGIGVLRRRRWTFWLILVASLPGCCGCRWPTCSSRVLTANGPHWYVSLQGLLGVLQFAIGLAMVAGYRRAGVGEVLNREPVGRRAPHRKLVFPLSELAPLGQRCGQCSTLFYLVLP